MVRQQILIAGAIALLLSLIGGYLLARWLTQRVKRLEQAAEHVAAGDFEHPIEIDSTMSWGNSRRRSTTCSASSASSIKARKQFIATASHELRTPVFSLGGFVELLEDEDLDAATRRRFLGHVAEQVERLRKLSVDLLDLSRLESGSLELRPEQVDLGELTRSVSAEFEPSLAQHDAHLELRLARHDRGHLRPRPAGSDRPHPDRQRAGPHARRDPDRRHRRPRERDRPPGRARRRRRDRGRSAMSRIFEPFFTADDAQGSGLGLAIASELAERMDGRLRVSSAPGPDRVHARDPGLTPATGRGPPGRALLAA